MRLLLFTLLTGFSAFGAVDRRSLDIHLPTQGVIERQTISAPGSTNTTAILSANAGAGSAAAITVSSFSGQPDVARNLIITPRGTTNDVADCIITVTGTDILGNTISERFGFSNNASTATVGVLAFKTVTSVAFPANCEDGGFAATWDVGYGTKLGLNRCMSNSGDLISAEYGGVHQSTRPIMVKGSTTVSANTMILQTPLLGSDVVANFIQNFVCLP